MLSLFRPLPLIKESGDKTCFFLILAADLLEVELLQRIVDVVDALLEDGSGFGLEPLLEGTAFSLLMRFRMDDDFGTVTGTLFFLTVFNTDSPFDSSPERYR